MIAGAAIRVLWLREMKRFFRAKSRIAGALLQPLFFLVFLGLGFNKMPVPGMDGGMNYIRFLVPGILGMTLLFSSSWQGLSVLWDREFGFLKEIMVAPVGRMSIVIGRIAGGTTTTMIQGLLMLGLTCVFGFRPSGFLPFLWSLAFMVLISFTFIGLGLSIASMIKDMQGFGLIANFIMMPLFFLSGALYPLNNLPRWVRVLSYADPLTYGVDGLRGTLIGVSTFPVLFDFLITAGFAVLMIILGTVLFERSESV